MGKTFSDDVSLRKRSEISNTEMRHIITFSMKLHSLQNILLLKNSSQKEHIDFFFVYKKIWSVSTQLSEYLIAIRHLNKFESVSISIYKQQ